MPPIVLLPAESLALNLKGVSIPSLQKLTSLKYPRVQTSAGRISALMLVSAVCVITYRCAFVVPLGVPLQSE